MNGDVYSAKSGEVYTGGEINYAVVGMATHRRGAAFQQIQEQVVAWNAGEYLFGDDMKGQRKFQKSQITQIPTALKWAGIGYGFSKNNYPNVYGKY